jgi:hypothetical protein
MSDEDFIEGEKSPIFLELDKYQNNTEKIKRKLKNFIKMINDFEIFIQLRKNKVEEVEIDSIHKRILNDIIKSSNLRLMMINRGRNKSENNNEIKKMLKNEKFKRFSNMLGESEAQYYHSGNSFYGNHNDDKETILCNLDLEKLSKQSYSCFNQITMNNVKLFYFQKNEFKNMKKILMNNIRNKIKEKLKLVLEKNSLKNNNKNTNNEKFILGNFYSKINHLSGSSNFQPIDPKQKIIQNKRKLRDITNYHKPNQSLSSSVISIKSLSLCKKSASELNSQISNLKNLNPSPYRKKIFYSQIIQRNFDSMENVQLIKNELNKKKNFKLSSNKNLISVKDQSTTMTEEKQYEIFDKINSMGFTKLLPWTKDKVKQPSKKSTEELPKINQNNFFGSPVKTSKKYSLVSNGNQK